MTLLTLIKRHEGLRLKPYTDTVGVLTIGYGRNLFDNGISTEEAEFMLLNDIRQAMKDLKDVFPECERLNQIRQDVLISMMFNMGKSRFLGFRRMLEAIKRDDFDQAADEMLDSAWAQQVKGRAIELAKMMREG